MKVLDFDGRVYAELHAFSCCASVDGFS